MEKLLIFLHILYAFTSYAQDTKLQALESIITPQKINGVAQQLSITQLRQLRPSVNDVSRAYYCIEKGKEGEFLPDYTDNNTSDDGAIVILTQNNIRLKRIVRDNIYFAEWWNAKGDGITDDTQALQNAINYISTLLKGGTLRLKSSTYLCSHLFLKKGVSISGTNKYSTLATQNSSGTTLKCISNLFQESFIDLFPDNTFINQNGEIDGLAKSMPEFTISNITFDANYLTKYTVSIKQAWTFSFDYCKFYGGFSYSLNVVDCNEFKITNSVIKGFLSISNADYIVEGNDMSGNPKFPALVHDRTGLGNTNNNKIYLGGNAKAFYKLPIKSITNGIFTFEAPNLLTNNPDYNLYQTTGNISFNEMSQELRLIKNSDSLVAVTTLNDAVLLRGNNYKLTGTFFLKGYSNQRTVKLSCGNVSQIYTINNIQRNQTININVIFRFNPSINNATSPLKITLLPSNFSGVDTLICTNVKIKSLTLNEISGIPVVFNYPNYTNNTLANTFPHSEVYYPKFTSDTTMVLYQTLSTFSGNGYLSGTFNSLQNHFVEIPNSVIHISGKAQGHSAVFSSNKIEDINNDGIVCRGCYNYVFVGNKFSKGINSDSTILFSLIKGATKNVISGNTISGRINATSTDLSYIGLFADEFSGSNEIIGNQISNNGYLDIVDKYNGPSNYANKHDINNIGSMVYIKKPTDYQFNGKRLKINSGGIGGITNNNIIINNSEFTLLFKNIAVENQKTDVWLFQQKDINIPTQKGPFGLKISSNGSVVVSVNSTIVLASNPVIIMGKSYEIALVKDLKGYWYFYLDGELITTSYSNLSIATNTGTKSYIAGSPEIIQGGDLYLQKFLYYKEGLLDFEIKNIYSNFHEEQTTDYLLNSKVNGLAIFSNYSNVTISQSNDIVTTGHSILVNTQNNGLLSLNLSSENTKGNIIRLSYWAKSNQITKIGNIRKSNLKFSTISKNYQKIVKYVYPDQTTISTEGFSFTFGKFAKSTFGQDYSSNEGNIYFDNFYASINSVPVSVSLDLSESEKDGVYINKMNYSDEFVTFDGMGGFSILRDKLTSSIKLKRNITANNTSGNDALMVDNTGIYPYLKLYSNIYSKSGNTINLEVEGRSSILFKQEGNINAQLFENGNFAVGTNPSDDGSKLQISGDFSLKSGKFKVYSSLNSPVGSTTLVNGTITISNSSVTTSSQVFITTKTTIGIPAINYNYRIENGTLTITAKNASNETEIGCNSIVSYFIIN